MNTRINFLLLFAVIGSMVLLSGCPEDITVGPDPIPTQPDVATVDISGDNSLFAYDESSNTLYVAMNDTTETQCYRLTATAFDDSVPPVEIDLTQGTHTISWGLSGQNGANVLFPFSTDPQYDGDDIVVQVSATSDYFDNGNIPANVAINCIVDGTISGTIALQFVVNLEGTWNLGIDSSSFGTYQVQQYGNHFAFIGLMSSTSDGTITNEQIDWNDGGQLTFIGTIASSKTFMSGTYTGPVSGVWDGIKQ